VSTSSLPTRRLVLVPCSVQMAQAALRDRDGLESRLGAQVPQEWPGQDLREFLPLYAWQLQADPALLGWGIWLMIHAAKRTVIGDAGFKGKPGSEGTVEIGYSVLPAYRGQGFATEAARALVDWALAQRDVRGIIAECSPDNAASIRVLEKLDMQRREADGGMLRWELTVPRENRPGDGLRAGCSE
jgi:ribosomal-protein-alanine N-acetyltransferase